MIETLAVWHGTFGVYLGQSSRLSTFFVKLLVQQLLCTIVKWSDVLILCPFVGGHSHHCAINN